MRIRACLLLCLIVPLPLAAEGPAVWRVSHAGVTDYLVGSIHLLPAGEAMPARYAEAYAATRTLVFESDIAALRDPTNQLHLMAAAELGESGGLEAVLPAELYRRLSARLASLGLPFELLRPYEPWFAAMTLESLAYLREGFSPLHGVELWFHQQAVADGRTLGWYETPREQFELFAGMPRAIGIEMLEATLEQQTASAQPAGEILAIWRDGDLATLAGRLAEFARESPDLYARLLADRNRRWLPSLLEQLRDREAQLIVVGLAHFVGPDGLIEALRARGIAVERMP